MNREVYYRMDFKLIQRVSYNMFYSMLIEAARAHDFREQIKK